MKATKSRRSKKATQLNDLTKLFLTTRGDVTMRNLVRGLFTDSELEMIHHRVEIVRLLKKGMAQQKIALRLRVGVATVTRLAKQEYEGRFKKLV